jgi:hypothetical protein
LDGLNILLYNRGVKKNYVSRFLKFILPMLGTFAVLITTAACVSSPLNRPWVYADLKALDTLDAPSPATEILAVYSRSTDLTVEIRVDLLDINAGDKYTLKVDLWDNRNFVQAPLTIIISSTGSVQTTGIRPGGPVIWPRVIQSNALDTITISLNRSFIGQRYQLDISTFTTDPVALADEVLNLRSDSLPPIDRAPTLLTFWDAFPAATPTQALRRWDGAHTGPLGDRHGLFNLLKGAEQSDIPVALLDLKNPASLAALDFIDKLAMVKDAYERGLLILPDTAYGEPASVALDFSRRASAGFGLPTSQFVYAVSSDPALLPNFFQGYRARFLEFGEATHLGTSGGIKLIPLPPADAVQATISGPSLEVRRALIEAAISPDPADLVVLGGSLPHSTWGDSDMAYPTFEWLAAHPWIQPLTGQDLLTFPAQPMILSNKPSAVNSDWVTNLRNAPDNSITQSAWQVYLDLTSPSSDVKLQALKASYLGQVGELLQAAKWAEAPTDRTDCKDDLNGDGHIECILANQNFFAILEPEGARLTQFFHLDEHGPHQIVGTTSQFTVGLSDPSEWDPARGEAADPSMIQGAFTDDADRWTGYTPVTSADGIAFTNPGSSQIKTYRLTQNGIEVIYQSQLPVRTRIPLVLDPQSFYFGPTNYLSTLSSHSWIWGISGGSSILVRTDAGLSADGFTSAIPFISSPEDPNQEYPAGNYIPFPLSVVTIQSTGSFYVEIAQK